MTTPPDPRPKPRSPFGPALDEPELRGWHRRFRQLPLTEQLTLFARTNWNLLDPAVEHLWMHWLADCLRQDDPEIQGKTIQALSRLPHSRRARHVSLYSELLPELDADLAARLADAFGPVLGGAPRRRQAPKAVAPTERAADAGDLDRLQAFFARTGRAR
ncbi:MAG: hypothetical protein VKP62_10575 [Candidatus Sericytochromatia bacterium]|nr:hypothetical protein [Candidatus Sericytochromatia bacterium]